MRLFAAIVTIPLVLVPWPLVCAPRDTDFAIRRTLVDNGGPEIRFHDHPVLEGVFTLEPDLGHPMMNPLDK